MKSDCLVLQIEEIVRETNEGDHKIYILFDKNENHFVLRGKRRDVNESDKKEDIVEFLSFIMDTSDCINYRLYNKFDLPWKSDDITYENLDETMDDCDELVGYDMVDFSRKTLRKRIAFLETIYNFY